MYVSPFSSVLIVVIALLSIQYDALNSEQVPGNMSEKNTFL